MTGKAPPSRLRKEKPRSARPYDRPNQGILGKVASRVRGLFKTDWLLNASIWGRTNVEEQTSSTTQDSVVEPDLTENEDELEAQPLQFKHSEGRIIKQRPESSRNRPSESSSPFWLAPSTSRESDSQNIDRTNASVIQECESVGKDSSLVANGMLLNQGDDHSENSDNSASTSGCSSLVSSQDKPHRSSSGLKLSESALELLRGELKCNLAFQKQRKEVATITSNTFFNSPRNTSQGNVSLWSCGTLTPGKSPQIPSLHNSSRPSFSVSSFGGPSNTNSPANKIASPFYEGSTTFGGASSYRKRQLPNTPYQTTPSRSVRCQVKVNSTNKEFECMSSAAKRILHTLETMSTPITDAKKIPNVNTSPLFISPPSHRYKSYLLPGRSSPVPSPKGPPVVNLTSVSKLTLLKSYRSKVKNSMMELPLNEQPMVSLPPECSASKSDSRGFEKKAHAGGGKMKTKRREPLHASSKSKYIEEEEEVSPAYDLPDISIPVCSVPVFSFEVSSGSKTPLASDACSDGKRSQSQSATETPMPFKFSTPIQYSVPNNIPNAVEENASRNHQLQNHTAVGEGMFKFSSPLAINPSINPETGNKRKLEKQDESEIYKDRSINEILKSVCDTTSSTPKEGDDAQQKSTLEEPQSKKAKSDSGDDRPASESCSSCMGLSKSTCSVCSASSVVGFGDKFKPKSGSWMCTECLIQNGENSVKCVACETPKPSTSSTVSSSKLEAHIKPGSWECSTCLIRNNSDAIQCAACETTKPGLSHSKDNAGPDDALNKKKDSSNELSAVNKIFQDTSGTWECDACMVRNSLDKDKCIACETLRASKDKTAGNSTSFKFGVPSAQTASFKFGSFELTSGSTPITSTFTFGAPLSADPKPGFIFGNASISTQLVSNCAVTTCSSTIMSTCTADDKEKTEGFTFSTPIPISSARDDSKTKDSVPVSSSSGGFQFGSTAMDGGFKMPKSTAVSVPDVGGFQFSKPADVESPASGGFQLAKPATSLASEGFKFSATGFGSSSFGGGFKFGDTPVTTDSKTSASEGVTTKPSFAIPPFSLFGKQSDDSHSKTDSQKSQAFTSGSCAVITQNSAAPMFAFAASSAPIMSTVTTSSVFGSSIAQPSASTDCKKTDEPQGSLAAPNSLQPIMSTSSAPFSFNPSKTLFPSAAASGSSVNKILPHDQIPRTHASAVPVFSFGAATTTTTNTSSMFTFGATTSSTADTKTGISSEPLPAYQKNTSLFDFGSGAKSEVKPASGGFSFKPSSDDKPSFPVQNQVGFGGFKTEPANIGSSVPAFKFGSTAPSTGGFVFGAVSKTDSAPPNAQFTFGSTQPKPAPSFGAFQQNPPTATTMSSFSFGTNLASSSAASAFNPTGTTAFTFNGKSQPSALNPTATAPAVAFGSQTAQPLFGGTASAAPAFGSAAPSPAFGSSSATPAFGSIAAPKADFNFTPQQQQQSNNLFVFGSPAAKKPMAPAQGMGFNFMPTQVDANTNFAPNFNLNNPPSFNFSSTPTNQPFQFVASSDTSNSASSGTRRIRKAIRRGIRKD